MQLIHAQTYGCHLSEQYLLRNILLSPLFFLTLQPQN
nr:MAG TPA: hypothetical protein [Caudoviricetes sp.]